MTAAISEINKLWNLALIRYSKVWEDHHILSSALEITEDDIVVSITSAGDNTLNLLLERPKKIVAVDISPAQNAILELKIAAIKCLSYEDYLLIVGVYDDPEHRRLSVYQRIRESLPTYAQTYWDNHGDVIESGILWSGRLDRFIAAYHRDHLLSAVGPEAIDRYCTAKSLREQQEAFQQLLVNDVEKMTKQYLGMENVAMQGRSWEQYRYLEMPEDKVGSTHWEQMYRVCRNVPVQDNFYLSWFLRGSRGFDPCSKPQYSPPYLTNKGFTALKSLVDRIEVYTGGLEDCLVDSPYMFSKANLSDVFEYMSNENTDAMFRLLASKMEKGGRMAFWNQLCPRKPSASLNDKVKVLTELSNMLHQKDRVFFYCAFYVAETI